MAKDIPVEYYNNASKEGTAIKNKWWTIPDNEIHAHMIPIMKNIRQNQRYREVNNLRFARMYSNQHIIGLGGSNFARSGTENINNGMTNRMTWNISKSAIDTLSSKIAKNKPRPLYLTDDGDWTLQRRAQNLTLFMQGLFLTMGTGQGDDKSLYGIGRRGFEDGCTFGLGPTKFYVDGGKIYAERVICDEIVVDDLEGRYGMPRQLGQTKLMPKEMACDLFANHADKIKDASSGLEGEAYSRTSADMVELTEAWHLPSGEKAKDGKKVICVENCTLDVDKYEKDYFPFLFQRWTPGIMGFYGIGVCEELMGIQLEINKTLRSVQIAHHLMSVPQVWLEVSSKTLSKHINNEIGGVKFYQGNPPIFMTPNAMNSEVYNYLETLYRRAYEIVGISQLSAQGKKPSGLDSGAALREFQDIESERFALAQLRYEEWFMDAANICVDMLRDIAKSGTDPVMMARHGDGLTAMKWKDVDIPDDKISVRPYPTSFLPTTPAGRLATVQEMVQGGFFDKDEGLEMLDFPDLERHKREKLAGRDMNRMILDTIINDGKYVTPEPFMNIESLKTMAQTYYLRGKIKKLPQDRLDMLQTLMADCASMLAPPEPDPMAAPVDPMAQMPMDPAGGMPPMAQPEQLPTSNLLPMA